MDEFWIILQDIQITAAQRHVYFLTESRDRVFRW